MRETKSHHIDSHVYHVQQLGAKQGRLVLARLLKMVGPAAVAAAGDAQDPVSRLTDSLTDEQVIYLCDAFAKSTRVTPDAEPNKEWPLDSVFDDHFAGRYGAMMRWLWACVDTNFGSFLAGMGLTPAALAVKASEVMSGTQPSPTPRSGASSSTK